MKITEHIVREQAYHLWNQSEEFWLAAKAEFHRIEGSAVANGRSGHGTKDSKCLEDNPASG